MSQPTGFRPGAAGRGRWGVASGRLVLVAAVVVASFAASGAVATAGAVGRASSTVDPSVGAAAQWIVSHQDRFGAISQSGADSSGFVSPIDANYAALGLARAFVATGDRVDLEAGWRELRFYSASEQAGTSYVSDSRSTAGGPPVPTGFETATDSYAATFLLAAWSIYQAAPATAAGQAWLGPALDSAFEALESTEQPNGLYYAKPAFDTSFLVDDAEDFGGLVAASHLFAATGQYDLERAATASAGELRAAVSGLMWDATTGSFDWSWSPTSVSTSDPSSTLVPDAVSQLWAVAFGLATGARARRLVATVGSAQPTFDTDNGAAGTFPVSLWALDAVGERSRALGAADAMARAAEGGGWAPPLTTGDAGQLIVAETGGPTSGSPSSPSPRQLASSALAGEVNEAIGTADSGNTSEAAVAPFGMLQFGPQLANVYVANFGTGQPVAGLSLTNVDGVGCKLFGDVPILPYSGPVGGKPGDLSAPFSTSAAQPGSWQGSIGDVAVDAAATTRTGIATLQFPAGRAASLVVKAGDTPNGNSGASVEVASPSELAGSASSSGFCGNPGHYTVYFALESSVPFASTDLYRASGPGAGAVVSFGTPSARLAVEIKVGISFVSVAAAEANIAAEDLSWSTTAVADSTAAQWSRLLAEVEVGGGTPARRTALYSALYHSLLTPETFSDADGSYLGFDGVVHTLAAGATQYSEFSGWDIQVSEFPLVCLVAPAQAAQMAQSLVRDEEQGGWLPRWPVAASYTGDMEGDPADVILADAVAFGCTRGLDVAAAAEAVVKGALQAQGPSTLGQRTYWERYYGPAFNADGYAPDEASVTLQYSLDDFAAAQLARAAGLSSAAAVLSRDSNNWVGTFDSAVRLPEARSAPPPVGDGASQSSATVAPGGQTSQTGFMEGNATQYLWLVPEHLDQLTRAVGGSKAAASALSSFLGPMIRRGLDASAQQPYYQASNEEDLWAPWEGDFFGDPTLTERATSAALGWFYGDAAGGLPGNDDGGEMSSWGLWAMLGVFPMIPGTATMAVGSPEFTSVVLGSGGHRLTLSAPNPGGGIYVQATSFDGQGPLGSPSFSLPVRGSASLELEMGSRPVGGAFSSTALGGGSSR